MAAHRYWRAVALEAYGPAGLELSEFHLLAGTTRVDGSATLSSNLAPALGALLNLQDDNLTTSAGWTAAQVKTLAVAWDYGATSGNWQDVTDIRLAGNVAAKFPVLVTLQWSDDNAAWTTLFALKYPKWPGAQTKSTSIDRSSRWLPRSTVTLSDNDSGAKFGAAGVTVRGYMEVSTGVRQFEFSVLPTSTSGVAGGIVTGDAAIPGYLINNPQGISYQPTGRSDAAVVANPTYGSTWTTGDIIGVVVDFSLWTVRFYKNGVAQPSISIPVSMRGPMRPAVEANTIAGAVKLYASGLTYPIAGATAWSDGAIIDREPYPFNLHGTTVAQVGIVNTLASVAKPFFAELLDKRSQGRREYLFTPYGRGIGRVKGTTKDKGTPNVPVSERVRLHLQRGGLVVREAWSQPGTGAYSFDWIDELETYYVVTFDKEGAYRAVVADGLTLANGGVELIA